MKSLEDLANALISQRAPEGWTFHSVTFVWNSEEAPENFDRQQEPRRNRKQPIVREFTETEIGIPYARNRALDIARDDGITHLVFIDDDCLPRANWLEQLLTVVDETGADVVAGGWRITARGTVSSWLPGRVFGIKHYYFAGKNIEDRDELPTAYTRNVVFATSLLNQLAPEHQRFPESMVGTGGSDSVFFARAHTSGARIIYAPEAKVEETYDSSRLTLRWHFFRRMRNTQVRLRRRQETRESLAEPKVAAATVSLLLLSLPASVIVLPVALFSKSARKLVASTLLHITPLAGALLWWLGIEYQEYAHRFRFRSRRTQ